MDSLLEPLGGTNLADTSVLFLINNVVLLTSLREQVMLFNPLSV